MSEMTRSGRKRFRAGDTVKHRPTGETWILGADEVLGNVAPIGWPETIAKGSDCELIEAATDEERHNQLVSSARIRDRQDVRRRWAAFQLESGEAS